MTDQELRKMVARLSRASLLIDRVATDLADHIGDKQRRQVKPLAPSSKTKRQVDRLK